MNPDSSNMFEYMQGLTSLDLNKFDTSFVTTMSNMFAFSNNLISLDLSNFDTSNLSSASSMFN
jgi:surface protein